MPHFYVAPEAVRDGRIVLGEDETRHLTTVLRKKPGDEIELFNGLGGIYKAVLESVVDGRLTGRILSTSEVKDLPVALRLFQGLPKGDKFEWVLEKMTELGAREIVPLLTERGVAKVPAERSDAKLKKWEKIVLAAAKQCGRARVPRVIQPLSLAHALDRLSPSELSLIPWEGEKKAGLKSVLQGNFKRGLPKAMNVFIGPEGGFAPREVEQARARGALPVTLGSQILRTETAGLYVASAIHYELSGE